MLIYIIIPIISNDTLVPSIIFLFTFFPTNNVILYSMIFIEDAFIRIAL